MTSKHVDTSHRTDTALVVFTRTACAERKRFGMGRGDPQVAEALVAATLDTVAAAAGGADVIVAVDGVADASIARCNARVLRQRDGDFEERFVGALEDVAALGYTRVVVVGTDTPTLAPGDIRAAVTAPAAAVTIGPSHDGGFYLLGIESTRLGALRGLPWKGSQLLSGLVARLRGAGTAYSLLPGRRDVDDAVDAHALRPLLERLSYHFTGVGLDGRQRTRVAPVRRDIPARSFLPADQGPPRSPPLRDRLAG